MSDRVRGSGQLSLVVLPDPSLTADAYIAGGLKLAGELVCPQDLNAGDEITVTVADADGTVIAQGTARATVPAFREIMDRDEVVGTERINRAKIQ
ncbi:MAG: hypothetical protein Q8O56_14005 [Solirubrobacteraceae bacterium]|nr:hypothetical protein [Solirubrobacteraceae bacterium]